MNPTPLFTTKRKGTEEGWHAVVAKLAVAALTVLCFSRNKARERWWTFATLLPSRDGWVLYRNPRLSTGPASDLIVHENVHVRDADRVGVPLFCTLYVINPLTIGLAAFLVSAFGPWCWLALLLCATPNPFRAWFEWRAYRAQWEHIEDRHGAKVAQKWARKLPRLFAGPDYGFMSPVLGLWLWVKLRHQD